MQVPVRIPAAALLMFIGLGGGPMQVSADTIPPEITTAVELSNSDINRIVCPGTMNDLIFSREKGLEGHFSGNSAYLKFKITKTGEELTYTTTPSELFVVCNQAVYSLIATPKQIPAVTLRLAPPAGDTVKSNVTRYQDMPLEKRVLQLIRDAASGEYPSSYRIMAADVAINLSADLKVRLYRVVEVDGVGLRLKEFQVTLIAEQPIQLSEKMFLAPEMGESILAIAVERHTLESGETTRVMVVEQKERSGNYEHP